MSQNGHNLSHFEYLTPKGPVVSGAYRGGIYKLIIFNVKAAIVFNRILYQFSLKTWGIKNCFFTFPLIKKKPKGAYSLPSCIFYRYRCCC